MVNYRLATREEVSLILDFIKKLAIYEKMQSEVSATEQLLEKWIFDEKKASVLFAEADSKIVGFALYFYNFSTFLGKPGIYLEDLFVLQEERGKGYGKGLILSLVKLALDQGCGRVEWCCLDWNTPSIDFYKSLGAIPMDSWTTFRLTEDKMKLLIS